MDPDPNPVHAPKGLCRGGHALPHLTLPFPFLKRLRPLQPKITFIVNRGGRPFYLVWAFGVCCFAYVPTFVPHFPITSSYV